MYFYLSLFIYQSTDGDRLIHIIALLCILVSDFLCTKYNLIKISICFSLSLSLYIYIYIYIQELGCWKVVSPNKQEWFRTMKCSCCSTNSSFSSTCLAYHLSNFFKTSFQKILWTFPPKYSGKKLKKNDAVGSNLNEF